MKMRTVSELQPQDVPDLFDPLANVLLCGLCSTSMYDVLENLATDREEQNPIG